MLEKCLRVNLMFIISHLVFYSNKHSLIIVWFMIVVCIMTQPMGTKWCSSEGYRITFCPEDWLHRMGGRRINLYQGHLFMKRFWNYTTWLLLNRGRRYHNTPNKPVDTVPVFGTFPFHCEDMVYVRLLDHTTVSYNNMTSYFGMTRVNPTSALSEGDYSCDPPAKK